MNVRQHIDQLFELAPHVSPTGDQYDPQKHSLVWLREERGVAWYNCPSLGITLDLPRTHNWNDRQYIVEQSDEMYLLTEDGRPSAILGRNRHDQVLWADIREDAGGGGFEIVRQYVMRIVPQS